MTASLVDGIPWLEKYRPQTLNDVVGNEETIAKFKAIIATGNMPNMILAGPPGIGKTTTILCLARQLLGDLEKEAVLELNASDDRGIDTIRNKVKMFAMKKVNLPPHRHKLIILDEADSMTSGAQQALRRIMEIYSGTTRFALACNISSKIIEPIQSRCAIVRFGKLSDEQIFSRIKDIAKLEQAEVTTEGLEAVVFTADGDMRQAINNLQSTVAGFGLVIPENVYKICDLPNPGHVEKILELISQGQMENAFVGLRLLYEKGFSASDIVGAFFKVLKYTNKFAENVQLGMMREVGMAQLRVVEGSNSLLQLCAMLAKMIPA